MQDLVAIGQPERVEVTMSAATHSPFDDLLQNCQTVLFAPEALRMPPLDAPLALARQHVDAVAEVARSTAVPGYALVALGQQLGVVASRVVDAVAAGTAGGTVIVGRHDHCQLELGFDLTVALRHLVVRVITDDAGDLWVRVLDLRTGQGFHAHGVGRCDAIWAAGPVLINVGQYLLALVPSGPTAPSAAVLADAWRDEAPQPVVRDARAAGAGEARSLLPMVVRPHRRDPSSSAITMVMGPHVPQAYVGRADVPLGTAGTLTVFATPGRETTYPLSREDLRRGALIGRYERCAISADVLWGNESMSRVHLLLLEEAGHVLAIDTGSTIGTIMDGAPIACAVLPLDAQLQLGIGNFVRWSAMTTDRRAA